MSATCPDQHNWQPWFHHPTTDRLTRHCAGWNCPAREEVTPDGVTHYER